MGELTEIAEAIEEPLGGVTGLHPREERAKYAGRAVQSRFLQAYLYRLDDDDEIVNPDYAASRNRERFARSRDGRSVIGSWEHLDDIDFRGILKGSDAREFARLVRIVSHADDKIVTPPSRSTIRRHRLAAEQARAEAA